MIVTLFGKTGSEPLWAAAAWSLCPGGPSYTFTTISLQLICWATPLEHFCSQFDANPIVMDSVDMKTWINIRRENPPSEQKYQEGYSYADYQQFLESLGVFLHFDCSKLPGDDSFIIHQPSCSNRLTPIVSGGQYFAKLLHHLQLMVYRIFVLDFPGSWQAEVSIYSRFQIVQALHLLWTLPPVVCREARPWGAPRGADRVYWSRRLSSRPWWSRGSHSRSCCSCLRWRSLPWLWHRHGVFWFWLFRLGNWNVNYWSEKPLVLFL